MASTVYCQVVLARVLDLGALYLFICRDLLYQVTFLVSGKKRLYKFVVSALHLGKNATGELSFYQIMSVIVAQGLSFCGSHCAANIHNTVRPAFVFGKPGTPHRLPSIDASAVGRINVCGTTRLNHLMCANAAIAFTVKSSDFHCRSTLMLAQFHGLSA